MSYRAWYWAATILIVLQTVFYNLYAIPTYTKIIDGWVEYSEQIEWELDGCYELKIQFNDLYEEYEFLAPELGSEQYTMRMRVQ